ncbi:DUF1963 domain-containing protein [Microcoleus vaginatus]|uniref:DUF1963 domain-containing protein n=1 Tax=Microcoleus vaginatus TaxID=119532 RepID=UPI0016867D6C|nr:DUF1963 domain-containing protein [Microcoleus sp. FACHB-84]MBD2007743.1 DUF1963 domain-containing protein [Microcoleus sp. FACHB-45]
MDITHFLQMFEQTPLALHQDYLCSVLRPAIDIIRCDSGINLAGSRYGGSPDLPERFEWPTHHLGLYRFLGQFNFAEIPHVNANLPERGLLSLFVADDPDGESDLFWGEPGYIHAEFFTDITRLVPNVPPDSVARGSSSTITFRQTFDLPFDEYQVDEWPFQTDELCASYGDLRNALHQSDDYLLGYPSHCTLAYDPTPGAEWISLFTANSDDELAWDWHDGDKLTIFIEIERLKKHDFSNLRSDAG